jgi:hypothetical protein
MRVELTSTKIASEKMRDGTPRKTIKICLLLLNCGVYFISYASRKLPVYTKLNRRRSCDNEEKCVFEAITPLSMLRMGRGKRTGGAD